MPSYPPRNTPARQKGRLLRSESILRDAIEKSKDLKRLTKFAENVRHYHLQVLKARKVIAKPACDAQNDQRIQSELANIENETVQWQTMPVDEILLRYGLPQDRPM
ncbi:hypothetical protein [Prosthecobacter sp.]|jgi:hypothetical protein|uniref:hypothetical protein n=1 Tax=Prosthecobacter sp. TaxID=1965333 RepID=UPI0037C53FF5